MYSRTTTTVASAGSPGRFTSAVRYVVRAQLKSRLYLISYRESSHLYRRNQAHHSGQFNVVHLNITRSHFTLIEVVLHPIQLTADPLVLSTTRSRPSVVSSDIGSMSYLSLHGPDTPPPLKFCTLYAFQALRPRQFQKCIYSIKYAALPVSAVNHYATFYLNTLPTYTANCDTGIGLFANTNIPANCRLWSIAGTDWTLPRQILCQLSTQTRVSSVTTWLKSTTTWSLMKPSRATSRVTSITAVALTSSSIQSPW